MRLSAKTPESQDGGRLFDDKIRDYLGYARRAETAYSFLDRSGRAEYAGVREMIERWISRLPLAKRKDIVNRMRHKGFGSPANQQSFDGAFFELCLHEFLNGTGGRTQVDPKIGRRTPDFQVSETGPDGKVISYVVEATDVNIIRNTDLESDWNELQVLDILDEIKSPVYYLYLETKGVLTEPPPKRKLKEKSENFVKNAIYDDVRAMFHRHDDPSTPAETFQHKGWSITARLVPVVPGHRLENRASILFGLVKADVMNDIGKAKDRLYDKAKQYQNVDNLIIAIRINAWPDRMDQVLFGSTINDIIIPKDLTGDSHLAQSNTQKPDGFWFNTYGPQNRHVIGVAVFKNLNPGTIDQATAVFYANPYSDKPLPEWTRMIAHADYSSGKAEIVAGDSPHTFIKDYVSAAG